ncbi:hypothetical protein [Actinomadura welshii]|uniref:hypothetical protein n=1 Tax=Actinomadura welshii TaxID=3103817 RepID=UPI001268FD47|nr:hypothetical protein [Actinomadura madurae]
MGITEQVRHSLHSQTLLTGIPQQQRLRPITQRDRLRKPRNELAIILPASVRHGPIPSHQPRGRKQRSGLARFTTRMDDGRRWSSEMNNP